MRTFVLYLFWFQVFSASVSLTLSLLKPNAVTIIQFVVPTAIAIWAAYLLWG